MEGLGEIQPNFPKALGNFLEFPKQDPGLIRGHDQHSLSNLEWTALRGTETAQ